nr:MAG TPA: hypothetical protein [Caudoviricetes sp.]
MVEPPRCYRKGFLSFTSTCYQVVQHMSLSYQKILYMNK